MAVVRLMLSGHRDVALTFTSVANEAQVSRRTLYTYWGTIERLVTDAVSVVFERDDSTISELPVDERLMLFLRRARDRLATPLSDAAFSVLVPRAVFDEGATDAIRELGVNGRTELERYVGPVTPLQYNLVVGPLLHSQIIDRVPLADHQLDELARYAMGVLGLGPNSA